MTGRVMRDALRRRLGGVAHRDDRAVGDEDLGAIGEQRRDVRVRSDTEEADVERRPRRAVVAARSARAPPRSGSAAASRSMPSSLAAIAWMFAAGMSRASSSASRACFSLRSSSVARDEALVAPPEVHARPVDAVAARAARRGREHRGAHRAAGERDVREAAVVDALGDAIEEACGDGLGESGGIGADHDALLGPDLNHASRSCVRPAHASGWRLRCGGGPGAPSPR